MERDTSCFTVNWKNNFKRLSFRNNPHWSCKHLNRVLVKNKWINMVNKGPQKCVCLCVCECEGVVVCSYIKEADGPEAGGRRPPRTPVCVCKRMLYNVWCVCVCVCVCVCTQHVPGNRSKFPADLLVQSQLCSTNLHNTLSLCPSVSLSVSVCLTSIYIYRQ